MSTTREKEIERIVDLFSHRLETELGQWYEMMYSLSCEIRIQNKNTKETVRLYDTLQGYEVELSNNAGTIKFISEEYYVKLMKSYHEGMRNQVLKEECERLEERKRDESAYSFLEYYTTRDRGV